MGFFECEKSAFPPRTWSGTVSGSSGVIRGSLEVPKTLSLCVCVCGRGGCEVKTVFITILRHYLPFSFLLYHEGTVEFPKGCITCVIAMD